MAATSIKTKILGLTGLLSVAAGVGGCPDLLGRATNSAGCLSDDSCPNGTLCTPSGQCVPLAEGIPRLYFVIEPAAADKRGATAALPVELTPDEATYDGTFLRLVYPDPVEVQGEATVSLAGLDKREASKLLLKVRITAPSDIPGQARLGYVHDLEFDVSSTQDGLSVTRTFSLNLAPGKVYTLQVLPDRADWLPPSLPMTLDLRDATEATVEWKVAQDDLREIHGLVLDALATPLAGVQAWLTDATGMRVSTLSAPTDEDGAFSLTTLANTGRFVLHVAPADDASALPHVQMPVELSSSDPVTMELAAIVLPPFRAACEYVFQVLGSAPSGADEAIPGATVVFHMEEITADGLDVSYESKAVSDPDGTVRVELLPGTANEPLSYQVTVLPPVDSSYAALYVAREVSTCGATGASFVLSPRATVGGVVLDPSGNPLDGVTVVAKPSPETDGTPDPLLQMVTDAGQSFSASTEGSGRFLLRLDPGVYDLQFLPPASSALPRWHVDGVVAEGGTPVTVDVQVPASRVLPGTILDAHGRPMAGMQVKAYVLPEGCPSPCANPAMLVSEAAAGPNGEFLLLLPSETP